MSFLLADAESTAQQSWYIVYQFPPPSLKDRLQAAFEGKAVGHGKEIGKSVSVLSRLFTVPCNGSFRIGCFPDLRFDFCAAGFGRAHARAHSGSGGQRGQPAADKGDVLLEADISVRPWS